MKVLQTLLTYAQGYAQQNADALVKFIAPDVITGTTDGYFKKFNNRQDFQLLDTLRTLGGAARRIEFGASDGTFACKPHALEVGIDDEERKQAGDMFGLEQAKIRTLISNAQLSHGYDVITAAKAAVAATSSPSDWGSTGDPISDIDGVIKTITLNTGLMPNRVLMGFEAWVLFRKNAKVIARLGANKDRIITQAMVGGYFLNPNIEFMVSTLVKDVNINQTVSKSEVTSGDVFIFLESGSPSQYDPGFMRTFRTAGGGIDSVVSYRDEAANSDIYKIAWSEQIQVVSTISGGRLTVTA